MGLFAVGIFVFLLTFGVIAILGAVYWLRGKGIIRSENAPSFTEDGAEYYVETVDIHTEKPDEKPTVSDVEFQEIDKK